MTTSSIKKYSILGLVLVAASAVMAKVVPAMDKSARVAGHVENNSTAGVVSNQATCRPGFSAGQVACEVTAGTVTTTDGNAGNGRQTNGESAVATLNNTTD